MKRPTMLLEAILAQASLDLGIPTERDVALVRRRIEHEGLSFLTITLPLLSDALERGLESGQFTCPSNFSRHGNLPRFLGGFFNCVFDRSGLPLPKPSVECIAYIRQICRFFKKLKMLCSADKLAAAETRFLEVEEELFHASEKMDDPDLYLDLCSRIWFDVFEEPDPSHFNFRHGPGATAERLRLNQRRRIYQWYDRFDHLYPADLIAYPNFGFAQRESGMADSSISIEYKGISEETPVRIVFVPKTMTTPRVIAIEPSCMQFVQQGAMDFIVKSIERHRIARQSIRFSDQSHNVRLARESSRHRRLSTLDLKEASDRVHLGLVRRIFKGTSILDILENTRSLSATLPSGTNVILSKYASMGSALCFPVEAMVFYTIILAAIHESDQVTPTLRTMSLYSKDIDVYGDDIIIPTRYVECVVRKLERYNLLVNVNKSFSRSLFRESCGGDFYDGQSVKPIYAREVPPDLRRHWTASQVMSWVATANLFYSEGKWLVAQAIREMLDSVTKQPIPVSSVLTGDGLYFYSVFQTRGLRFNQKLYAWEQRRLCYTPVKTEDVISGDLVAILNNVWGNSPQRPQNTERRIQCQKQKNLIVDHPESLLSSKSIEQIGGLITLLDCSGPLKARIGKTVPPSAQPMPSHISIEMPGQSQKMDGIFRMPVDLLVSSISTQKSVGTSKSKASTLPLASFVKSFSGLTTVARSTDIADIRFSDTVSTKRGGFIPKHRWVTLIS